MEDSGWDWGSVPQWLTLLAISGFAICITLWLANVVEEIKDLSRTIANLSKSAGSRSDSA
jgi:hypothetical protein